MKQESWLLVKNKHVISLHGVNTLLETKLGLILVRSSFLLAGFSFWPKGFGTTT